MPLSKKVACLGGIWVEKSKMERKMNENKQGKGSHVTLENPIRNEDLYNKLFEDIMRYDFITKDNIYLYITKKQELNRRVFFSNQSSFNQTEYLLIGKYKYHNFFSPLDAALVFAATITTRVKELSGAT